jgi:uncharacterized protein YjiS (DUF1127 family)
MFAKLAINNSVTPYEWESLIPPTDSLAKAAVRAHDLVSTWMDRARQRRTLLELDTRMLSDVGLSRADAVHEADKPFWQG